MLSLYSKNTLTPSTIKQRLIKRHLLDSSLQKAQIFYQIKRFIDFDIAQQITHLQPTHQIKIIQSVLTIIQKSLKDQTKLIWMKAFTIHALFKSIVLNFPDNKIIVQTLLQQINQIKTQILGKKSLEPLGLISRSLSKIKRSLRTQSLKKIFGVDNEQVEGKSNKLNELQESILLQYILYLQKIIHDWFQLQQFISPSKFQASQRLPLNHQSKTSLVWKIFNIFKKLSKLNQDHLRIHHLFKDYLIYFYSMMNFISNDIQMLYNPLVDEIKSRIKAVDWEEIVKLLEAPKKMSGEKENMIPRDNIMQIHSMIQELGNVNQVVLYIFLGSFHHKYLYKRSKPSSFVSINQKEFDKIYEMAKRIKQDANNFKFTKKFSECDTLKSNCKSFGSKWMKDSVRGNDTEIERCSDGQMLMGLNNKFLTGQGGQNRMKAVNYKSQKLKEMQKQDAMKKQ